MKWDVFRAENRSGGAVQHVGIVSADTIEGAQTEAEGRFDCRGTQYLYVSPVADEYDDAKGGAA